MFYEHFKIEQIMVTDGYRIVMLIFERKTKNISKEKLDVTVNNVFEL
jgi:hypothetical protein